MSRGYINCSHFYILKHLIVVSFQYVYSQLHLFRTGANVPINRHPSFHFKKLVFSFIHKSLQRERESDTVLFIVHKNCSASLRVVYYFILVSFISTILYSLVCKFYFISLIHSHTNLYIYCLLAT